MGIGGIGNRLRDGCGLVGYFFDLLSHLYIFKCATIFLELAGAFLGKIHLDMSKTVAVFIFTGWNIAVVGAYLPPQEKNYSFSSPGAGNKKPSPIYSLSYFHSRFFFFRR